VKNRHPDDAPILISNHGEFKKFIDSEMNGGYFPRNPYEKLMNPLIDKPYEKFKNWIEHPLVYPCMVFLKVEDVDFRPGYDFITYYFYPEDAKKLLDEQTIIRSWRQ
jgi:hypothetical protein